MAAVRVLSTQTNSMGAIAYTTLGALAAVLLYGAGYLVLSGL